jgi:hypothetical protein
MGDGCGEEETYFLATEWGTIDSRDLSLGKSHFHSILDLSAWRCVVLWDDDRPHDDLEVLGKASWDDGDVTHTDWRRQTARVCSVLSHCVLDRVTDEALNHWNKNLQFTHKRRRIRSSEFNTLTLLKILHRIHITGTVFCLIAPSSVTSRIFKQLYRESIVSCGFGKQSLQNFLQLN